MSNTVSEPVLSGKDFPRYLVVFRVVSSQTEALTRQIQQASDILEVVGQYVALKPAGASHKGLCPFHTEKTPSFSVNPSRQIFKCFGCGAGGDVFKFLQLREGISFSEARALLAQRAGISLALPDRDRKHSLDKAELARLNEWAARLFRKHLAETSEGAVARRYVQDRHIRADVAERFGLGYALDRWDGLLSAARQQHLPIDRLVAAGLVRPRPEGGGFYDTFRHRLMFPIRDVTNRVIGFGGRTLGDDPAKYLNSTETALFQKGRALYGLDQAKQAVARAGHAIVVEGYTDCLMAHQHGLTQTVATLGTALTESQVQLLRRFSDQAVLVFDSDQAGQRAADRAVEVFLSQQLVVRLARIPEGKDPCDFLLARGREPFEQVIAQATDALEYRWQRVAQACQPDQSPAGQLRAVQEFLRTLATSAALEAVDPIRRGLLLNRVGKLLSLSADEVHRQLAAARRSLVRPSRSAAKTQPQQARADAGQVALRQIVEVLLNEPAHYEKVQGHLQPDQIADPRLAAVAAELCRLLSQTRQVDLAGLIGRFEEPEDGRLITDLELAGRTRANYAATVDGAIQCLERIQLRREVREAGWRVRADSPPQELEQNWAALVAKARTHRYVLPPKAPSS